jgi:aldehyde dehydrogenase (NAD+)
MKIAEEFAVNKSAIVSAVEDQRAFFRSGKTRELSYRVEALKKFKATLQRLENEIYEAVADDLHKPKFETYSSEIGLIYEDINLMLKKLKVWTQPKLKATGITNFPGRSYVYAEPFGVSLIIGAWNYPLQLTLVPLVGAIAAGNCAIVKPSELAPASSAIVAKIIQESFDVRHVTTIEGGAETAQALLEEKFDFIFFTGSTHVGRIVNMAAAKHLTPVVLELGGKSPCIVDQTADIALAAKRISWGKFFNAGQSCVAPDYVLVHASKKDQLVRAITETIKEFFGENPQHSPDLSRIVSERHFNRLTKLLEHTNILTGGQTDDEFRYIAPTLVEVDDLNHPIMQEEIFGPILPIITINDLAEGIDFVYNHPNPLALYIFSSNYDNQQKVIHSLNFGGGCVNDTVAHVGNNNIPFGGIGNSGMGNYHGKNSFEAFSHQKSVLHKAAWPDVPLRYPPYKGKLVLVKQIIK